MRNWIPTTVLILTLAVTAGADTVPRESTRQPPKDASKSPTNNPHDRSPILGAVAIGEKAPDFVLDGSQGREERFSKQRGQWVLLVFDDRLKSIARYDSLDSDVRRLGARVVAVCHEKQQTITSVAQRDKVDMLMLADATGQVSAIYGLYDYGASRTDPGFFVIDRSGVIRLAIYGRLFPPDQMFDVLRFATGSTID